MRRKIEDRWGDNSEYYESIVAQQVAFYYGDNKRDIGMNFGPALELLNEGKLLQRSGWNGKGMFIYKTVGNTVPKDFIPKFASLPLKVKEFLANRDTDVVFQPSLTMYTAAGEMQPGWLASQSDMLANDWQEFYSDADALTK